eukprot:11176037-Ditylum_brightwellii.AAC.1
MMKGLMALLVKRLMKALLAVVILAIMPKDTGRCNTGAGYDGRDGAGGDIGSDNSAFSFVIGADSDKDNVTSNSTSFVIFKITIEFCLLRQHHHQPQKKQMMVVMKRGHLPWKEEEAVVAVAVVKQTKKI